jgi:hypothetical protein
MKQNPNVVDSGTRKRTPHYHAKICFPMQRLASLVGDGPFRRAMMRPCEERDRQLARFAAEALPPLADRSAWRLGGIFLDN